MGQSGFQAGGFIAVNHVFFGGAIQFRGGFFQVGQRRFAAHGLDSVFIGLADQIINLGFMLIGPEFFNGGFDDWHRRIIALYFGCV